MVVFTIVKGLVSIAAGALTFGTVRNIAETISITKAYQNAWDFVEHENEALEFSRNPSNLPIIPIKFSSPLASKYIKMTKEELYGSNADEVIQDLKQMPRGDLLKLYLSVCEPISSSDVVNGAWDGILLNNNEIMVCAFLACKPICISINFCKERFDLHILNSNYICNYVPMY